MKIVLAIDPLQPSAGYRSALIASGALPDEVEIVQPGDPLPEEFDGLLISGGADVEPSRYGETPVNASVETNAARDVLDFELLRRAERIGAAVFGICRGLQVVNVALGGTLWQDLPTQRPRGIPHSFSRKDGHDPRHPAHVFRAARSAPRDLPLAAALADADGVFVNSRHHQAVKDLAPGLVPLAASPDDLVEAFARGAGPFLAAVQWHPENLVDRVDQKALFTEFLGAASQRAASRPGLVSRSATHQPAVAPPPARPEGATRRGDGNDIALSVAGVREERAALPRRGPGGAPEPA
jgi:putative glutamine amidotransferase